MRRDLVLGAAMVAAALWPSLGSAADAYKIDPEHAWVSFAIEQHPWARYLGAFHAITGHIEFDQADPTKSSVEVSIATKSVDTSNAARDTGELQTAGFLNGLAFPNITFTSTHIEKTSSTKGRITGDLTLAGVTKPVVLDATFNGQAMSPWDGKMRAGFSATAKFDTDDFGMTGIVPLKIGPEVSITIEVEAVKCGSSCP